MAKRTNAAGWQKAKNGKWLPPVVEIDGEWVPRTDVEFEEDTKVTPTLPPPASEAQQKKDKQKRRSQAVASLSSLKEGSEVTAHGARVILLDSIKFEPVRGFVEARVLAFRAGTNALLNVDDGRFHFDDPPTHEPNAFMDYLAMVIARYNGITEA